MKIKLLIILLFVFLHQFSVSQVEKKEACKDSLVGKLINGKKNGQWQVYSNGQLIRTHSYRNDTLHGLTVVYNTVCTSIKYVIKYSRGILSGETLVFDCSGDLIAIFEYKKGIRSKINRYIITDETPTLEHNFVPKW